MHSRRNVFFQKIFGISVLGFVHCMYGLCKQPSCLYGNHDIIVLFNNITGDVFAYLKYVLNCCFKIHVAEVYSMFLN